MYQQDTETRANEVGNGVVQLFIAYHENSKYTTF